MKRIVLMVLVLCSIMYGGTYSGGSGTEGSPYLIANVADWTELSTTTADWVDGTYVTLSADIDFGGAEIPLVGTNEGSSWSGQFGGDGHTLSNGKVTTVDDSGSTSIFPRVDATGDIKNLVVDNVDVTGINGSVSTYTAVLVGEVAYPGSIEDCHVKNCTVSLSHSVASQSAYVGMIAGATHGYTVRCSAQGTVQGDSLGSSAFNIGGLVGKQTGIAGAGNASGIQDCIAYTTVRSNSGNSTTSAVNVGGIAGSIDDTVATDISYIRGSAFLGEIDYSVDTSGASALFVGGIVGLADKEDGADIDECYSVADIAITTGTATSYIGGILGRFYGGTVDECYADVNLDITNTGTVYVGQFAGQLRDILGSILVNDCYATGTILDAGSTVIDFGVGSYGGFVGYSRKTTVNALARCYSAIQNQPTGDVKAFAFEVAAVSDTTDCFFDTTTIGTSDDDSTATATVTSGMLTQATYTNYNFTTTWNKASGSYPTLLFANTRDVVWADKIKSTPTTGKGSILGPNTNILGGN